MASLTVIIMASLTVIIMASLTGQMEELQKQQAILAEKIREEEERNKKLGKEASIERLEALIQPISECLDWHVGENKRNPSYRHNLNHEFESTIYHQRMDNLKFGEQRAPQIKYHKSHMLANEEIFVTLLGIIKKQEARICDLEATVLEY